jgi:hypothetical protein
VTDAPAQMRNEAAQGLIPDFRLIESWSHVSFWHNADMLNALTNVRCWGKSGDCPDLSVCPLMIQSGHWRWGALKKRSTHSLGKTVSGGFVPGGLIDRMKAMIFQS